MITAGTPVFPNNIIEIVKTRVLTLDSDLLVVKRPLHPTDATQSVGISAMTWSPDNNSFEFSSQPAYLGGGYPQAGEPTLQVYLLRLQSFVKDMDEERGQAVHSVLAYMLRSMLYRDAVLSVGLSALSVTMNGHTESTRRWGIRTQRYLNNEIDGNFLFVSSLEFSVETEIA